jgi:hypothetical protein
MQIKKTMFSRTYFDTGNKALPLLHGTLAATLLPTEESSKYEIPE